MKKVVLLILLFVVPSICFAYVYGSSNLSLGNYPSMSCYAPSRPYSADRYSIERYRRELEDYQKCVLDYLEGAENDIKRIQRAMDDAVSEYRLNINR